MTKRQKERFTNVVESIVDARMVLHDLRASDYGPAANHAREAMAHLLLALKELEYMKEVA